jgi:ABC-type Fe3+ transport system substrate-binding protein
MRSDGPRTTFLGKLVILAFVGACGWGAYKLFLLRGSAPLFPATMKARTQLRIACSDDRRGWLTEAAAAFAKTDQGHDVDVELAPLDAPNANVWAPASSLAKDAAAAPPLNEKSVALTPLVFVMWSSRLAAFQAKYGAPSLDSVAHALAEPRGWEGAGHPEWGLFKFAIADRDTAVALLAYSELQKINGLTAGDALEVAGKPALRALAHDATLASMREVASGGPDAFDGALVSESSALELLDAAEKRGGELRLVYPARNLWADNPYTILDAPWSSTDQRNAAQSFLDYLLSENGQQQAVRHGFRPVDPHVPTNVSGSPFVTYQKNGASEKVGQTCAPPPPAVMANLRAAWQRAR